MKLVVKWLVWNSFALSIVLFLFLLSLIFGQIAYDNLVMKCGSNPYSNWFINVKKSIFFWDNTLNDSHESKRPVC